MTNETSEATMRSDMLIRLINQHMELIRLHADAHGTTKGSNIHANCVKLIGKLGAFYYQWEQGTQGKHISELGDVLLVSTLIAHQLGYRITAKDILLDYRDVTGCSNIVVAGDLCTALYRYRGVGKRDIFYRLLDVVYQACWHMHLELGETIECVENALSSTYAKI